MAQELGGRVRELRQQAGLSTVEFAWRLKLATESSVYKLETGRSQPSLPLLLRIADVLQASIDYLLGLTTDPQKPTMVELVEAPSIGDTESEEPAARLFGQKLLALRLRAGWSQNELAHRLGHGSHVYLNRVEAGMKQPSLGLAIATAQLFAVSSDFLLRDSIPVDAVQAQLHDIDTRGAISGEPDE